MAKRPKKPSVPEKGAPDDSYKVGPGKPPRHSQYQPGRSGNPGGKKKGTLNLATVFRELLEQLIPIKGSGEVVTGLQALARIQMREALKGDRHALKDIFDRLERLGRNGQASETQPDNPEEDAEFLDRAMQRYRRLAPDRGAGNSNGGGEAGQVGNDDEDEPGDD